MPDPDITHPLPGDLLLVQGDCNSSVFLYRYRADGRQEWLASSTALLRHRGLSMAGQQDPPLESNYRPAPDFTAGRCARGQARALIRKYLPQLLTEGVRVLWFDDGFYHLSTEEEVSDRRHGRHHPAPFHRL